MVEHWEKVQFAFDVAWSAIKIGLLEAAGFMLEYIPIMFAPWFLVIDKVIKSLNMFKDKKLKTLTKMTADVKAAASKQLLIEQTALNETLAAHKAAAAKKKKTKETGLADTEKVISAELKAFGDALDKQWEKLTDVYTLMKGATDTFVDGAIAGIESWKSTSQDVFASLAKSFTAYIVGKLKAMAKVQFGEGIAAAAGLVTAWSAPAHFAAAGALTAAAGLVKALGGSAVSKIMSAKEGADFVATRPQAMIVGDNPAVPEHVRVTPADREGGADISISIGNLTVVADSVEDMTDQIFEQAELSGARIFRRGAFA